jgi:hypothetical protein
LSHSKLSATLFLSSDGVLNPIEQFAIDGIDAGGFRFV